MQCNEGNQKMNQYVATSIIPSYLGVLLSSDFYQHSSPERLLQTYLTLVCPHLEYASQVWNTSKIGGFNEEWLLTFFNTRCQSSFMSSSFMSLASANMELRTPGSLRHFTVGITYARSALEQTSNNESPCSNFY